MVPAAAMSHTNQRMCAARGPSSRRFNLRTKTPESTFVLSRYYTTPSVYLYTLLCETLTKVCRRQRWRNRWPPCHTCGNNVPQTWNNQQVDRLVLVDSGECNAEKLFAYLLLHKKRRQVSLKTADYLKSVTMLISNNMRHGCKYIQSSNCKWTWTESWLRRQRRWGGRETEVKQEWTDGRSLDGERSDVGEKDGVCSTRCQSNKTCFLSIQLDVFRALRSGFPGQTLGH